MNKNYFAVIMAGGIGSRFWPMSTQEFPKQFHDMLGTGETLLQKTFSRLQKIIPSENIFVLTNEIYLELTLKQLPNISERQIILEPAMRNTAACILLSALKIKKQNPDAVMLVAPSDHWIEDETAFAADVKHCFEVAQNEDVLLTLGIEPTFPNTGYGYIEIDNETQNENENENEIEIGNEHVAKAKKGIFAVKQFREKPDYETAKQFLAHGNFLWNAGIFIWSVKTIVASFEKYLPEMISIFTVGIAVLNTSEEKKFIDENYSEAENISIDYGILEKAENVFVKKATFDWNDLGTWGALHDKLQKDANNNSVVNAETHLKDSRNNVIFTNTKKLVVVNGIDNYIIVDNDEVLLLFPIEKEQEIKKLLQEVTIKFSKKYT